MINISIVEKDIGYAEKIKQLLKYFFFKRKVGCDIVNIAEYSSIAGDEINWGEYCFLDTELPGVEYVADKIKKNDKTAKIIFVGECCNTKNIGLALRGFSLGISAYILKTYTDTEILDVFACVFKII